MVKFIDDERATYGVELICKVLPLTPSTYYAHKDQQANPEKQSKRMQNDAYTLKQIKQIWQNSGCRYGARKVWQQLEKDGFSTIARCTVERVMQQAGIQGVWRGKGKISTKQRDDQQSPADLVKRQFKADALTKKRLLRSSAPQVADFTYIKTLTGWVYTAFIIDVFARTIVGWQTATLMDTQLVLDALNQAMNDRDNPQGVIHHSDKGSQYLSIKFSEKLKKFNLIASVGTTGDSYDNALAESVNGLYKSEVIEYLKQHWEGKEDVALATLNWVRRKNYTKRLHSKNGYLSPLEKEAAYYRSLNLTGQAT